MLELNFFALFALGFLGGGHCFGMCGGLSTALALQLPKGAAWHYLLVANAGRVLSYVLAGAVVGGVAHLGINQSNALILKLILFIFAHLLLIAMGLYLAGLAQFVQKIEAIGRPIWRRLAPVFQRFLPIRNHAQALVAGALWGWLPCGLVYTALLSALASASVGHGALLMLAFGLGTLPNVFLLGLLALPLREFLQKLWLRRVLGLSLCVVAFYFLWPALVLFWYEWQKL